MPLESPRLLLLVSNRSFNGSDEVGSRLFRKNTHFVADVEAVRASQCVNLKAVVSYSISLSTCSKDSQASSTTLVRKDRRSIVRIARSSLDLQMLLAFSASRLLNLPSIVKEIGSN